MKINHIKDTETRKQDEEVDKTESDESVDIMSTDSEDENLDWEDEDDDDDNSEKDDSLILIADVDDAPPPSMFIRIYKEELSQSTYNTRPGNNLQFSSINILILLVMRAGIDENDTYSVRNNIAFQYTFFIYLTFRLWPFIEKLRKDEMV